MSVGNIQSALIGFALFDSYISGMRKLHQSERVVASPLVDAAFKAFEGYVETMEVQHAAQIMGASAALYTLNPGGSSVSLITKSQMAPLLALNIMG